MHQCSHHNSLQDCMHKVLLLLLLLYVSKTDHWMWVCSAHVQSVLAFSCFNVRLLLYKFHNISLTEHCLDHHINLLYLTEAWHDAVALHCLGSMVVYCSRYITDRQS